MKIDSFDIRHVSREAAAHFRPEYFAIRCSRVHLDMHSLNPVIDCCGNRTAGMVPPGHELLLLQWIASQLPR